MILVKALPRKAAATRRKESQKVLLKWVNNIVYLPPDRWQTFLWYLFAFPIFVNRYWLLTTHLVRLGMTHVLGVLLLSRSIVCQLILNTHMSHLDLIINLSTLGQLCWKGWYQQNTRYTPNVWETRWMVLVKTQAPEENEASHPQV
jgi:hypothetical protein